MPKIKVPRTIREKLEAALIARGAVCHTRGAATGKRLVYSVPGSTGTNYYLGKAGSLRLGRTYTESIPSDSVKSQLLQEYEAGKAYSNA